MHIFKLKLSEKARGYCMYVFLVMLESDAIVYICTYYDSANRTQIIYCRITVAALYRFNFWR